MFEVFLISSCKTAPRLTGLLNCTSLSSVDLNIIRKEQDIPLQINDRTQWNKMMHSLVEVQHDNLLRMTGESVSPDMPCFRRLRPAEISIYGKHLLAMSRLIDSSADYGLILEDDIIIDGKSIDFVPEIIELYRPSFCDICESPGLSTMNGLPIDICGVACKLEKVVPPRTRNACSYLVSRAFASQFLQQTDHYVLPYDWALSYFMINNGIAVLWIDGLPITHGSQTGIYSSASK